MTRILVQGSLTEHREGDIIAGADLAFTCVNRLTAWSPMRSIQSLGKFFVITTAATTTAWYSHPHLLNLAAHVLHLDFKVSTVILNGHTLD